MNRVMDNDMHSNIRIAVLITADILSRTDEVKCMTSLVRFEEWIYSTWHKY